MKPMTRNVVLVAWLALAAVFFEGSVASAQQSPVGTWDLTVDGVKKGVAYLTFGDDYTIAGYIIVVPNVKKAKDKESSFGVTSLEGQWQYDLKGKVVGYLNNPPSDEVRLDIRSFRAKVGTNKMSMNAETEDGKITLIGIPASTLTDLTGVWTIHKKKGKKKVITFTEIFDALAVPDYYNLYQIIGRGANLCVFGYGSLSQGNNAKGNNLNVSFSEYPVPESGSCLDIDPTVDAEVTSAAIGTISLKNYKAQLSGVEQGTPGAKIVMPVLCEQ